MVKIRVARRRAENKFTYSLHLRYFRLIIQVYHLFNNIKGERYEQNLETHHFWNTLNHLRGFGNDFWIDCLRQGP